MIFDEDGKRVGELKMILSRLLFAIMLFDDDGVSVRCMNTVPSVRVDNIKSEQEVETLVSNISFQGTTPLGTELKNKIIDPMVLRKAKSPSERLEKPVLIITITDGQPVEPGGKNRAVHDTVRYASQELSRTKYGPGAVSFQFAQVGSDETATTFLQRLDKDPDIGHLIDCTSGKFIQSIQCHLLMLSHFSLRERT